MKQHVLSPALKGSIQYIGVASDEPNRFHNLSDTKRSPLVEAGWTEDDCRRWCEDNDLLSPIYTTATRGGCWFCHNVTYQRLRINHYFCKSREEYQRKHARGLADRAGKYQADNFTLHDLNDVHDESMLPYSALIAQKLRKQR